MDFEFDPAQYTTQLLAIFSLIFFLWILYLRSKIRDLKKGIEGLDRRIFELIWEIRCMDFAKEAEKVGKKKRGRPPKSLENKKPPEE